MYWVACAFAANVVCGLLVANAVARNTPVQLKPGLQSNVDPSRSKNGGACRVIGKIKIRSL